MGYKNKKSLVKQIEENLTNKLAIGESKHQAKRTEEGINEYSCAMKSHFRKSGNQMSGKWKSSCASLLA